MYSFLFFIFLIPKKSISFMWASNTIQTNWHLCGRHGSRYDGAGNTVIVLYFRRLREMDGHGEWRLRRQNKLAA